MVATDVGESRELLTVNMGPQHPSTHGVLRLELVLDGEVIVHCRPVIGYLHTGIEKTFEAKTYVQGVVLTDRMDYLNPLGNNLAYALSVEKLLGCEIPARATVLRVLLAEMTRLASHLMFIGSIALDLGASSPFLYCWREREKILDFFERMSGVRMMTSFIRPGGLVRDLQADLLGDMTPFLDAMPGYIDSYEELLTANPIFRERTEGIGVLPRDDALALGVYVVSDGSGRPVRVHERAPSFANLQALPKLTEGGVVADVVACIASLDPIMGEVDR